jgi:hypothetical protein
MEFKDNFSFGKYLEMHWRVEYLEYQLSSRKLVKDRRKTMYQIVKDEDEEDEEEDDEK